MTKLEFQRSFNRLLKDYGFERKLSDGQKESFYDYLKHHDDRDFMAAVRRIPAIELSTTYKPFPTAECIQKYCLDSQTERLYREKQSTPRDLEGVLARGHGGVTDETPGGQAWARLMITFIKRGTGNYRQALAKQFLADHVDWHDLPAWQSVLLGYVHHDYGYEVFKGHSVLNRGGFST